jgi:hypothetical protein
VRTVEVATDHATRLVTDQRGCTPLAEKGVHPVARPREEENVIGDRSVIRARTVYVVIGPRARLVTDRHGHVSRDKGVLFRCTLTFCTKERS